MDKVTRRGVSALHAWARKHSVSFHDPIFVAVSGGADSLALMAAAKHSRFHDVTVLTVDHRIQEGSQIQAEQVRQQAENLGLPCIIERVDTPAVEGNGNMEADARDGRYAIFEKYPLVLLAHTANDQMESMILGYGRGSGTRSVSGMREMRDGKYGRPFLSLTREDTEKICEANNLSVWHDPHNEHLEFRRVHVRKKIVPAVFEVFGEGVLRNFTRTATQLQEDADALDQWADMSTPEGTTSVFLPILDKSLPVAVKKRIVKKWINSNTSDEVLLRSVMIEKIITLSNGKCIELGGARVVTKDRDGWRLN